jgi:hypothetical protein
MNGEFMGEKIHPIFGGSNIDANKQAVKDLLDILPERIKLLAIIAKMHKAKYDALIDEGFSKDQALELCKSVTSTFL